MPSPPPTLTTLDVLERARRAGASLAGVASIAALYDSPSYGEHARSQRPSAFKSALVLALAHSESEPELDWWGVPGGTAGNRKLAEIARRLAGELRDAFGVDSHLLPYAIEKGGAYLKDAAVLAGLGIIGANNLLITPQFGPRVRTRALLLDIELPPASALDFAPCDACDRPCWRACPQGAFPAGSYSKSLCNVQMKTDEARAVSLVKYCRACELACPVGREQDCT